ncbi:hypothetical protein EG327_002798 [Venturia inaequalis]|uniref:Cytochrome c oxidase subunit 8, mitochondrial n=3 Tax=Venturia inaequalis TaxID=5025 RepID=A0A8H3Z8E1_VENIN|nr:hypothetical protein EG327_002798 [Venturia inaequalis]
MQMVVFLRFRLRSGGSVLVVEKICQSSKGLSAGALLMPEHLRIDRAIRFPRRLDQHAATPPTPHDIHRTLRSIPQQLHPLTIAQMLPQATLRASSMASRTVARRGFSTTRVLKDSPYHYPEGPRNNLPFNPLTKFFAVRYWGFMITGFGAPFAIAYWQTNKNK